MVSNAKLYNALISRQRSQAVQATQPEEVSRTSVRPVWRISFLPLAVLLPCGIMKSRSLRILPQ